jgi:hypothetical protein
MGVDGVKKPTNITGYPHPVANNRETYLIIAKHQMINSASLSFFGSRNDQADIFM